MTKYAAYGAVLTIGTRQVETCTVVGTITGSGNATFTMTASGMTGSPIAKSVAVTEGDTASIVAGKALISLNADSNITALFTITREGADLVIKRNIAAANDATLNLAYTNDTCTGLTPDASSTNTTAGVVAASVAAISSISGPSLKVDTVDVTTHDSTSAWEEVVATIVRSGEVKLDIVYDPAGATHEASSTGLVYRLKNKILSFVDIAFVATYNWVFDCYVTGFEPSAPVDGALTASITLKPTGVMTID